MEIRRAKRVWPAIALMVAVAVACGGDQAPSDGAGNTSSQQSQLATGATADAGALEASPADAGAVAESSDALNALNTERARCTSANTSTLLPPREADGFTLDATGALTPTLSDAVLRRTRHKGKVRLPTQLDGATALTNGTSNAQVAIVLRGATKTRADVASGYVVHLDARGAGGHAFRRPSAEGFEDFFLVPVAPAKAQIDYQIQLGAGIAGLRLIANTLELLDATGLPQLRVNPPRVQGGDCSVAEAKLALSGCDVDTNPQVPWGRTITSPGASTCTVSITWDEKAVTYPALVDPNWITPGNMASSRATFTATALTNGNVLAAGGYGAFFANASAEVLNVTAGTWAATASMSVGRQGHTATSLLSGKVLVAGGSAASAETWDPSTGTWTLTSNSMASTRSNHAATKLSDGTVLVTGGTDTNGTVIGGVELYTPSTNAWTTKASMALGRSGHYAAFLPSSGKVLVVAGDSLSKKCELFTPAGTGSGSWQPTADLLTPRGSFAGAQFASGDVLISGGSTAGGNSAVTELYSATGGTWATKGSLTTARSNAAAVLLPSADGAVLIAGGSASSGASTSVEVFNLGTGAWAPTGPPPHTPLSVGRIFHAAVMPQNGYVLELGGWTFIGTPLASGDRMDACESVAIDDGNTCTTDACDTVTHTGAVTHTLSAAVGASCNNSTVCNPKTCKADKSCSADAVPVIDDHNVCTTDACSNTLGITHVLGGRRPGLC